MTKSNTKKHKRRIVTNPAFQLKIFITASLSCIIFSALIIFTMYAFFSKNYTNTISAVDGLNKTIKTEDDIVKSFIKYASSLKSDKYELFTDKIEKDHAESITNINTSITEITESIKHNRIALVLCVILLSIQTIFFSVIVLLHSKKISGPIEHITSILKTLTSGRKVSIRPMRKKDEFQEIYALLTKYIEKKGDSKKN